MNTAQRQRRWTTLAVSGALLAAVAAGAATPALAADRAAGGASSADAAVRLAGPLDREALAKTLAGLPDDGITGALVRVDGRGGRWAGTAGDVPADARFRIGSISKVFTATVVLQLAAERKLDLDGTVQQYLPGLLPASYPPVTVGQLLDHTSGLPGGGGLTSGDGSESWFAAHKADSWTPAQVVADAVKQPMGFAPGTAQQYNGINTFVAGMVVEKVTGRTFAQEVQTRIARPLGLRDTVVPDRDDLTLTGPHAKVSVDVGGQAGPRQLVDVTEQSPWPWAEGGMISSAADLDRFMTALLRGRLLPPAQQAELFDVPDVPNHRNKNCEVGPTAGHACFSKGLMSATLPNGVVVWGKTGSRPGYTSGVFATKDLSRKVVYSVNPTNVSGTEFPRVWQIVTTSFGSGQKYGDQPE
ncbi:beta-lactamase family protein [Kitasatospora sp. RG8]|uniref:serine hydrolase domain-containing protein n=1 Tax=Kitasatospora sp. RG8 TaxID=2820815 RepID=UPI001AE03F8B|nr:serine hydrolase domain-containing protein [Kitasatospora sp. RG8]MBP0452172.1 beta-lactamase family protein [Kitasatospora sp. RG8]